MEYTQKELVQNCVLDLSLLQIILLTQEPSLFTNRYPDSSIHHQLCSSNLLNRYPQSLLTPNLSRNHEKVPPEVKSPSNAEMPIGTPLSLCRDFLHSPKQNTENSLNRQEKTPVSSAIAQLVITS